MSGLKYTEARKYAVIYQVFFLVMVGIFALIILLGMFRFESYDGLQGGAFGLTAGKWQILTAVFIIFAPLLIAFISAPVLINQISQSNRYIAGIIFTFICWFPPIFIAQSLDGMDALGEISMSIMPAVMAALMFGPLLGNKILALKDPNAGEA